MFQKLVISCCAAVLVAAFVTGYTVSKTTVSDPATVSPRDLEPNGPRELPLEFPLTDEQIDFLEDFPHFDVVIGSQEEADRWEDEYGEIEPGVPYTVYLVDGTYEEVFGASDECGPFVPFLCKSPMAYKVLYSCDIFNAAYEAGIRSNFTLAPGDFGHQDDYYGTPEGAMLIYNYNEIQDRLPCDFAPSTWEYLAYITANATPRTWALALGHEDYLFGNDGGPEYKPSVNVKVDNIDYTVTFKYGTFDELFSSDHSSCSMMFSELCHQGRDAAEKYTKEVIKALGENTTISSTENTDKFHIPFQTNDDIWIKTLSDTSSDPSVDGNCCDLEENISREFDQKWWASFSPRIGGYPNADSLYCNDEFQKSSKSADSGKSSFDPLERHTFTSSDAGEMNDFDYYYHKMPIGGDDHTFPDQDDACKNSKYEGTLALKVHNNDKEELVSFVTQPIVIDLAKYDRPEAFYQRFTEARSAATRTLRLIHSKYDKDNTLPKVKFHYQHDDLDNLYNDNEGMQKYWYLITTPPGGDNYYDPHRFGADDSYEGEGSVGTDPLYCVQAHRDHHKCNQTPFTNAEDHTFELTPGENLVYTIQLAEADDYESGAEANIADVARYWYDEELNQVPPSAGGFYIFTDATGILVSYLFQNKDDLLAASTFEVTHGAAYALAQDFKLNEDNKHLRMCRMAFKMKDDYAVQRVRNNDSGACDEHTQSWILPKFKWATRGTIYTNIWAEIVD